MVYANLLPGVFKDVFETRKASFEERFLNQKLNVREKNAVMYGAGNVNWNCLHSHSLKAIFLHLHAIMGGSLECG